MFENDPQNEVVDALRKTYLDEYGIDTSNFTNEQLIHKHGQDLEKSGLSQSGIRERHGSLFTDQYYDIKNRPAPDVGLLTESGKGFGRGASGQMGIGAGTLGLISGGLGLEGAEDYFMGKAGEFQQDAADSAPSIDRASDVRWDRPTEVARFLAGAVGEAVPSFITSLAGFGGGGVVGQQVGKQISKKAIRKTIQERGEGSASDAVTRLGQELIKNRATKIGAGIGGAVNSFGLSTGEIYNELYEFTQLDENDPDYVDPSDARKLSVGFGMLSGGLDFAGAGTLLSRLTGARASEATSYLKRLLLGLPEGVIVEGGTESLQELINMVASKYARGQELEFNDQELARMFDAGVLGAIGGTQFTALSAIKGPPKPMMDEPPTMSPNDPTAERQKSLLENLRNQRGQQESRYSPGDEVAIGLTDETGVLVKVSGDDAKVRLEDGSIKRVPINKLTKKVEAEIDQGDSVMMLEEPEAELEIVEPTPLPTEDKPKKVIPKGDQELVVDVRGETRKLPALTVDEVRDTKELYDTLIELADNDKLTKSDLYSNKTGGIPPTATAMKAELGPEKFKRLWTRDNLYRLRRIGAIDSQNNWKLGTSLDKKYEESVDKKGAEARLNFINLSKEWLSKGKIVMHNPRGRAKTNFKGRIKEVTTDGYVILEDSEGNTVKDVTTGEPIEFEPDELRRVAQPKSKTKKKAVPTVVSPQEEFENEIVEVEESDAETPDLFNFPVIEPDMEVTNADQAAESLRQKLSNFLAGEQNINIERELEFLRNDLLEMEQSDDLLKNLKEQFSIDRDFNSVVSNAPSKAQIKKVLEQYELLGFTLDPDSSVARRYTDGPQAGELMLKPTNENQLKKLAEVFEADAKDAKRQGLGADQKQPPADFDFKGKPVKILYTTGQKRKRNEESEEIKVKDFDEFKDAIKKWVRDAENSGVNGKKKLSTIYGIQIGSEQYSMSIDFYGDNVDFINVSGLEIDGQTKEELKARKEPIPFAIENIEIDEDVSEVDSLNQAIDHENSRPEGNDLVRDAGTASNTKTAVILREDTDKSKYPLDSIRVVSLIQAKKDGYNVVKGYDADSGKAIHLKEGVKDNFSNYSIIGKLRSTKPIGKVDLYFDNINELRQDPEFQRSEDAGRTSRKETAQFTDAKAAEQSQEADEAKLQELIKQRESQTGRHDPEPQGDEKKGDVKKRINEAKAEERALRSKIKQAEKKVNKFTGKGGKQEAKLDELNYLRNYVEEQRKLLDAKLTERPATESDVEAGLAVKVGDPILLDLDREGIKNLEDSIIEKMQAQGAKTSTRGDQAFKNSDNEGVNLQNLEDNSAPSNLDTQIGIQKETSSIGDEAVARAGRDLVSLTKIKIASKKSNDPTLLSLSVNSQELLEKLLPLIQNYIQEKKSQEGWSDQFLNQLDDYMVAFYNKHVNSSLAVQTFGKGENKVSIQNFQTVVDRGNTDYLKRAREKFIKMLEFGDQGGLAGKTAKRLDFVRQARDVLKRPNYLPYEVITLAFKKVGVFPGEKDTVYDQAMEYFGTPVENVNLLSENEIITEVLGDHKVPELELQKALYEIYGVEIDPGSEEAHGGIGIPTEDTLDKHDLLMDDLSTYLNPNFVSDRVREPQETTLASRYTDPAGDNQLNPSDQHIPNKISPVTGVVDQGHVLVTDDETNEISKQQARETHQSYTAPVENPLENYPELMDEARAAIKAFAPEEGVPFQMRTALNQIMRSGVRQEIKDTARLLDSEVLKGYTVEFMEWDKFRPYASPSKGVLNKAVALPKKKKIIISTAFKNSYRYSGNDMLAAEIVHEALHLVTKPALDLGYAYANGKAQVIERMMEEHGDPSKFNMEGETLGKVWININDTLIPYLRDQAGLDDYYGLTSIDEFFSELRSNPKFQDFLSKQRLPKSMNNRGIFRTALDYIVNFLARIGMSVTKERTALDYANDKVKELISISNELTPLHTTILNNNIRRNLNLGSKLDTDGINNSYDAILERLPREAPQGSNGGFIKDIADVLRGSTKEGEETQRRRQRETEALDKFAKENGIEISRASFQERLDEEEVFGGEHEVYLDTKTNRFNKSIKLRGMQEPFVLEYLERLAIHNSIFPETSYTIEGIMNDDREDGDGFSRVVTSQAAVDGDDPSQAQIDEHMESIGFTKLPSYNKPIYRKGDIDVWDVRPGNAAVIEGKVYIFDPRITKATRNEIEADKRAIELEQKAQAKEAQVQKMINEVDDLDTLIGMMAELDGDMGGPYAQGEEFDVILGSQFSDPQNDLNPRPNARPDDNAMIMTMANTAGFNELVDELIKVHREVGDKLGLDINKFLEVYGRPGGRSPKKIKSMLKKDLEPFGLSEDISIEDTGLNSVARSFGVRRAISNLERVRENARKNKQSTSILVEDIENKQLDTKRLYEDLQEGRYPARGKLIERFRKRLNATSFQKLEEYARSLPNSGISQADINSLKDFTEEQLGGIMESIVETTVLSDGRGLKGFAELEYADKQNLLNAIEGSNDPRLSILKGTDKQTRLKRLAVSMAIRDSRDVLSLLRLSKGLIGTLEQRFLDAAKEIANAPDLESISNDSLETRFPGIMSTPLKQFVKMRKFELEEVDALEREKAQIEIYDLIDRSLGDRSARLRMALGEMEPVAIHDGVTLVTLELKDGEWKRGTFKVSVKGGKLEQRDEFLKANKETLRGLRDQAVQAKYGNEPWWDIMREQAELAMAEPILDEHFHAQRAAWFSGLQGLTERFSKLGYEGKKLAQMGTRTVALYRDYAGKSMAYSKLFNVSFHKVMKKLKMGGNELYAGLYQDIFWWFDNHPEYAGKEEQAFSELWKHLRENANIPDRTLLDEEARRLTKDMVNKAIQARDWETSVNKALGNRVRDDEIKVESFVNQEMVDFYRMPLEMGFATMPRTLNDVYLGQTALTMKKEWGDNGDEILSEAGKIDEADFEKIYSTLFTDKVVDRFVKPYTNTDVRQSVFRGPQDEEGHRPHIGNSFINDAFKRSQGNVFDMANLIYDEMADAPSTSGRSEWHYEFLKQWFGRYKQIQKVSTRVSNQKHGLRGGQSMGNTPQSLDARQVESRLPKEFFYYNMYDEVSSNVRLALMTATASFGRNGENANRSRLEGVRNMEDEYKEFNNLMMEALNAPHDKPRANYSRAIKRKAFGLLRDQGVQDAEKRWNQLYSNAIAVGEFEVVFDQLGKYYGKDNVSGPYQDANLLLEILGAQSIQVLNNPKSSFWQALSLFEFPNAFRGLNKMAGKSTASALGNFVNQTFGGMAEAMGMQLGRAGRYAEMLNDTHYRMDEMDLSFREYNSMLGAGGDLAQSIKDNPAQGIKRYIRMAKNLATHQRRINKDGTRAPIDALTPFTGIFPYVNNVVNHSIGVGAINAYSDLILQSAKVIEQQGLTDYRELSALDLGMGNKTGEWVIGEQDGYDRANEMLVAAGGPTISRLAFDYVDRKKNNENALPIEKNMALLINQVAMNNVAGEGFNSKPSWLYTSPGLRYFSTFLGWPLGKMGRDLQFIIRDPSDKVGTYKALLKYIALMGAVYTPVGLSFAMLIDWYDEEMLEKPNSLPPISPWAALPILGIPLAMRDEHFSMYSITSRMAKAGVPFGIGMDVVNGLFAKGDPYGSARELSLDSRIFAFSMFKSIYDAVGTWMHAEEFDWQMVGRPILYGIGGNSVIQMMDLTSSLFDLDNEEKRVADYIGMRNYIKKSAFLMGLELRPPMKGGGKQSPLSINTRQMARAAFANDTQDFLKQYQEAVEAAREKIKKTGRTDTTPEKLVIDSYKDRDLRAGITARKISDDNWNVMMNALPEDVRMKILNAEEAHKSYLGLIGGGYRKQSRNSRINQREARIQAMMMQ